MTSAASVQRVFVATTSSGLLALVDERRLPGPVRAHAVTAELREQWPDGDQEQWEYAVLNRAAEVSADLRGPGDRPRRYVVAADVAATTAVPGEDPSAVEVSCDIVWADVAAAHADTVDDATDDLAWYARQEIADMLV